MEREPTNNRSRLTNNVLTILRKSYKTKPTVAVRLQGTGVRFSDTISITTSIDSSHHILRNGLERMQTRHKNTRVKVRSIYPSLMWHATEMKKKKSNTQFEQKSVLSALPDIRAQKNTTVIDPVSKTVYDTIQLGPANNIYDKLINDEETNPMVYKTTWLLNIAASDMYADNK